MFFQFASGNKKTLKFMFVMTSELPNSFATDRIWQKVIFQWSKADLNSKFTFTETGDQTKIKVFPTI